MYFDNRKSKTLFRFFSPLPQKWLRTTGNLPAIRSFSVGLIPEKWWVNLVHG